MSGWEAGSLAKKPVNLRAVGDGFNFTADGSWWAEHRVSRINSTPWGNARNRLNQL